MKHICTSGPWSFSPLSMEIEALVDPENSKTYYAPIAIIDGDWSPEIKQANAQLIAAAPDMLAALQAIEGYLASHAEKGDAVARGLHDMARAAIANADPTI